MVNVVAFKKAVLIGAHVSPYMSTVCQREGIYLLLVYLVTALVPSLTACFASSPGNNNLTAV